MMEKTKMITAINTAGGEGGRGSRERWWRLTRHRAAGACYFSRFHVKKMVLAAAAGTTDESVKGVADDDV